jgi:hypothetical protein
MMAALERDYPGCTSRALVMTGTYREATAPCGTPIGSASAFARRAVPGPYMNRLADEVWELADFEARYYAALRCALALEVQVLHALNPSSLLTLFAKAEQYADALVEDLRRGTLTAGPPGAQGLASVLAEHLTPRPELADRFGRSVKANGRFMPREVWPTLRLIQTWKGGAASHYLAALKERCPGCAVRSAVSGSSEGLLLVPLRDEWVGGVPALSSSVLEFFPEHETPERALPVPLAELSESTGYRVMLTNRRGMYRYVMDDVFIVEGRTASTPVMRFSHRYGQVSSLTGEKLTEPQIDAAVTAANAPVRLQLVDYQVAAEWGEPPRYLLMLELGAAAGEVELRGLLAAFEAALAASNIEYAAKRGSGRLGPPALVVLERGEFERQRRQQALERGGSDAQVKVPKLRRDPVDRTTLRIERAVFSA